VGVSIAEIYGWFPFASPHTPARTKFPNLDDVNGDVRFRCAASSSTAHGCGWVCPLPWLAAWPLESGHGRRICDLNAQSAFLAGRYGAGREHCGRCGRLRATQILQLPWGQSNRKAQGSR
jgi:hypothetical protein